MSSELIKHDILDNIQDPVSFILNMGKSFGLSTMFGVRTVEQGQVLALHCLMTKSSPLSIMQQYHMIEGKLSMKSEEMLRRFSQRGGKWTWISDGRDGKAVIELEKDGRKQTVFYSLDDAKTAGLLDGKNPNWKTRPQNMLRSRVVSEGMRMFDPESTGGCYTEEELQDAGVVAKSDLPSNVIEGEVIPRTAAAEAIPAAQPFEPAKRTRKAKEPEATPATAATSPATTPAATVQPEPVKTEAPQSAESSVAAVVAAADPAHVAAPVETPVATAPAGLPKIVTDIIELRDYVGPRWPNGKVFLVDIWPQALKALGFPDGESDEERLTKADDAKRSRMVEWLLRERGKIDKLATSTDLNAFANQTPTTSAK